jgi:23S rRNA (cytosine1962-C5)-methyltransferase
MTVWAEALARRRARLAPDTEAFRWVDEEVPAVTVDLFGAVAVLSLYREFSAAEEAALADALWATTPLEALYLKRRPREARKVANERPETLAPPLPLRGRPVESLQVRELGVPFEIRPANGLSVGLYLDAREARGWVREHAAGRRVLNLFSYTCGFGLAARLGGATRAVNIDASRKVLDWGEANLLLSGVQPDRRDFISGDAFDWLKRLAKKGDQFDLVVMDPPGFANTATSRFTAARDYHRLVEAVLPVAAPGATLLAMCNVEALSAHDFDAQLTRGLAGREFRLSSRFGASEIDFRAPGTLKCVEVELDGR